MSKSQHMDLFSIRFFLKNLLAYKKYCLILVLSIISNLILAKNYEYFFQNLSVKDGLSQMSVLSIIQDKQGFIWFGTRDGLNRYNGYTFEKFYHNRKDSSTISDGYITCLKLDRNGEMWVGTSNGLNHFNQRTNKFTNYFIDDYNLGNRRNYINSIAFDKQNTLLLGTYFGLYSLNKETGKLSKFKNINCRVYAIALIENKLFIGTENGLSIISNNRIMNTSPYFTGVNTKSTLNPEVRKLFLDSKGNIWTGSNSNGLLMLDKNTYKVKKRFFFDTKHSNWIKDINEDNKGHILISTHNGLKIYNYKTDSITSLNTVKSNSGKISHLTIDPIFIDKAGTIWIGTYSGGVSFWHSQTNRFLYVNPKAAIHEEGVVVPMLASNDKVWFGCEGIGLSSYSFKTNEISYFPTKYVKANDSGRDIVTSIFAHENTLFVGSYGGELHTFDIQNQRYKSTFRLAENAAVNSIIFSKIFNSILLGTSSTIGLKKLDTNGISDFVLETDDNRTSNIGTISSLLETDKSLWIGTRDNGVYHYKNKDVRRFGLNNSNIAGQKITTMYVDRFKNIYIGTFEGGLSILRPNQTKFQNVDMQNGLTDNTICAITEDRYGKIWITTKKGLTELSIAGEVIRTFDQTNGIQIEEFSPNAIAVSNEGTIYAGGSNGFISFNPDKLFKNNYITPVLIQSVTVNNEKIGSVYQNNEEIKLSYNENNITIECCALNYINPENNQYAYKIEGINDDWNYSGTNRFITYANLSPGNYIFRVKCANNDGIWNEQGTTLQITIKQPFWNTIWAWIFYIIIGAISVYYIIHYLSIRQNLAHEILIHKKDEELHRTKVNFFTNFSHELRTPLTLILGPLEDMIQENITEKLNRSSLVQIYKNAQRILLLVNNLMDISKKESGSMKLSVSKGNMSSFAEEILVSFKLICEKRNIKLMFESVEEYNECYFDHYLFEKVFLNLYSNAVKFTPDGGTIKVSVSFINKDYISELTLVSNLKSLHTDCNKYVCCIIEDNGNGIPQNELNQVFEPFHQVFGNSSTKRIGTGIGLSLSKGIVELHHGALWAESENAKGSKFTVLLPEGKAHFGEIDMALTPNNSTELSQHLIIEDAADKNENIAIKTDSTILIVEDNKELRHYISKLLSPTYKVIEAENGKEGVLMSISHMPNLIISDIMMPITDGLTMCNQIKNDLRTSHIPVILLSARSSVLHMKEGLEIGADDYIIKPFSSSMLILKVNNILRSRENLKNLYGKRLSLENMGIEVVSGDDKFLQKLSEVIENHISDPDLNINNFCDKIGMSKSNLYRKIKAVTNLSASEYVKSVRLNMAAKMIIETDMQISDIALQVGFKSLIHFSTIFKKAYGVPPSKYRTEKK